MSLYDATVCARTPLLHRRSVLRRLTNSRRFLSRSSKYLASFLGGACPITSWQAPKEAAGQAVALCLQGQRGTHLHDMRLNCKLYHSQGVHRRAAKRQTAGQTDITSLR